MRCGADMESASADLLRTLPVALLIVNANGIIELSSRSAERALNSHGDLRGRQLVDVLASLDELRTKRDGDRSVALGDIGGRTRRFGYSISNAASPDLFSIVFRDITRVAHVAAERDRLVHLAAVGAVVPSALHELKNSLAALTMGLELLVEESDTTEQRERAEALTKETQSIATRLNTLGAASQPLRTRRPIDLDRPLSGAREVLEGRAERAQIGLKWVQEVLQPVYVDPGLVHEFAVALGTNAIEASRSGSSVRVAARLEDGAFELCVDDDGEGMSRSVRERCTDLFFSTRDRSRGIGLTLCDQAVRAGGGTLRLESEPGRGSRVTIRIPRATEFLR